MKTPCSLIHTLARALPKHRFPFDQATIPDNGIYLLFENGEEAHSGERIVRIGTHTGEAQLCPRLQQHFVVENKDRSIFRKNIGRAILTRDNDPYLKYWELDLTTREARRRHSTSIDSAYQKEIEHRVSQLLRDNFSFVAFRVDERGARLALETKLISTVASCEECSSSNGWLGHHSPKQKIRESGLWLVNKLSGGAFGRDELEMLPRIIRPI